MRKYKKKPKAVKAVQWNGSTQKDLEEFIEKHDLPEYRLGSIGGKTGIVITTPGGMVLCKKGEWLIKGEWGWMPCSDNKFKELYEPV